MAGREIWKQTERLAFGRWQPEDVELARALWGDPQVTRLFSRIPWTDEQVLARLASEIEMQRAYGVQYWPLFGRAVIEHALGLPQVAGIFAGHHPDNAASGRVLAKLGFKHTHDEFYEPTGAVHPSYMLRRA